MGITLGTSNNQSLPLTFRYRFGGSDVAWPQPYKINDYFNSSESIDGKYRISDMDLVLVDPGGSNFTQYFGNGTRGFGSSLEVVAYLGGTMDYQSQGLATVFKAIGTAGAQVATIHTGKVYGINYSDRKLRIRSKNKMALLKDLKWQFPIRTFSSPYSIVGSYLFTSNDERDGFSREGFYDFREARTKWRAFAYTGGSKYGTLPFNISFILFGWPQMEGRGQSDIISSSFYYAGTNASGTNFYDVHEILEIEGTYLTTYGGTISDIETAYEYGYSSVAAAEAAKSGGSYTVNKTRFGCSGTTLPYPYLYFVAPVRITGNPGVCFRDLLTGAMVSPYFYTSDIDTPTFNESGTINAYSNYDLRIGPNSTEDPLDSIKTFMKCTQALFSVNSSNKFEWRTYGPKNLQQSLPTLGVANLISSALDNYEEDLYNRFVVKYEWDWKTRKFGTQQEIKTILWRPDYDLPLTIESKWILNSNEAFNLLARLKARYDNTVPHVTFRTNLNQIGFDIGTLVRINDPNSVIGSRIVQLTGFTKGWQDKTIEFEGYDGESLWYQKGYAHWEDANSLTAVVSGTSTSGWGSTNGTCDNINTALYGTVFHWF